MILFSSPIVGIATGILASALLSCLYALGGAGWLLGFILFVPWLLTLNGQQTMTGTLVSAYLMSVAYTAAVFAWFGFAIGSYTQLGAVTGLSVLLLAAPLFQPQFLAFAIVRYLAGRQHGPVLRAFAAAAAWVATEWLVPKLLGDTLGYGLYPSRLLRQAADIGGAAGLTVMLLLANEGIAAAIARRAQGWRATVKPLALSALLPLLLAGYSLSILSSISAPATAGKPLRMGLIQANIVDYERQRQEKGAHAVVREVLDKHFAMTYDAVVRQRADAVLWSETIYPTTFSHPKSEAGAELDQEILGIVNAAGVPFVFGTYDRDTAGEYNAAAFVVPGAGLLGFYRKTRLFPLTEYVPAWLDSAVLRRWLPWTGTWRPGNGARVFPLRLADGRDIPVLPLICLDDVDTGLAIDGARLGAQAILSMSNDAWFTNYPQGAELHQSVAAFRSIETRLPQFRVTTNGYSAVIDASGSILAGARMGERTLVIADVPVPVPPSTLMVKWGNWVGLAGSVFLISLTVLAAFSSWLRHSTQELANAPETNEVMRFPARVTVLPPAARVTTGILRSIARGGLLWMGAMMLFSDTLQGNTLAQIRVFTAIFLLPEAIAWCVLFAFAAQLTIENGMLVITRGSQRMEIAVTDIAKADAWRLPVPGAGISLWLNSGERWHYGLALANPSAFIRALRMAGSTATQEDTRSRGTMYVQARLAMRRGRLDQTLVKFVLLPLVLVLPAFHLHQHIAYGSGFGEYYSFGMKAYLMGFALWWAAWTIGVALGGAALRATIEGLALLGALVRPEQAISVRRVLERCGLAILYLGVPAWLFLRIYNS
ncbi:apolipoprotein N-acyltransferase [Undibacterium sp. RuTC16W]|uniref:apolipoprotein N-acyltransferase n=1 Tax=Undibacterium sp. RuTC16W TaxID=3413048 RepID=UPI003BEF9698